MSAEIYICRVVSRVETSRSGLLLDDVAPTVKHISETHVIEQLTQGEGPVFDNHWPACGQEMMVREYTR